MGFNDTGSTATITMVLTDYGKSKIIEPNGGGLFNLIHSFGIADDDIDYNDINFYKTTANRGIIDSAMSSVIKTDINNVIRNNTQDNINQAFYNLDVDFSVVFSPILYIENNENLIDYDIIFDSTVNFNNCKYMWFVNNMLNSNGHSRKTTKKADYILQTIGSVFNNKQFNLNAYRKKQNNHFWQKNKEEYEITLLTILENGITNSETKRITIMGDAHNGWKTQVNYKIN